MGFVDGHANERGWVLDWPSKSPTSGKAGGQQVLILILIRTIWTRVSLI